MNLSSSFIVGLGLAIVAYDWFTEFGHIRETAIYPVKADNESMIIPNGTLTLNETFYPNDTLVLNERTPRSKDDIVNKNLSLTKEDIKRTWYDHFRPTDSAAVPLNTERATDLYKPADSVVIPRNSTNTTEANDILINVTASDDYQEDHRSYTRNNPPFVSLLFSSFSFCLAGAVIIITSMFEKQCLNALQEEQSNNGSSSDHFISGETERLPLHPVTRVRPVTGMHNVKKIYPITERPPVTSREVVPCNGDGVHEDFVVLGQGSGMVIYDRPNATRTAEDPTNVPSTSTSPNRTFFQENQTTSTHDSDLGDLAAGKRVQFDEPQFSPVMLYPQYRPGMGRYWCAVCNSILAPIQESQKHPSVTAPKQQRKKKSSAVNLEEIQGIAQTLSQAQTSRENCNLGVAHTQSQLHPVNTNAKLKSKPGAENTLEMLQEDKPLQASYENLAALLRSVDSASEGEYIEMKSPEGGYIEFKSTEGEYLEMKGK
ncbi:uncharacterized protein [Palaemon carinicauda]